MKWKFLVVSVCSACIVSCASGNNEENMQDTGNLLNDTFPATRPVDSVALDSNPADGTKIDTGKGDWH